MNTGNAARILVIEDNETNRELMMYLLRAFGYETLEAVDGEEGVEAARRERPDLIVCDIHLPKLDGYGVNRQLKLDDGLRNIPVIAVTALAMVGDRDKILAAGFDGYVSKPIAPETFVENIEKHLPPDLRSRAKQRTIETPVRTENEFRNDVFPGSLGTIVVIDDVPANLDFACSTLKPFGYAVLTARSVDEAMALTYEKKPALFLCDLHMYPKSGLDLLSQTKTNPALQNIPVVIISSSGSGRHDRSESLACGAANFIRRPVEPQVLLSEIAQTLKKWRAPCA